MMRLPPSDNASAIRTRNVLSMQRYSLLIGWLKYDNKLSIMSKYQESNYDEHPCGNRIALDRYLQIARGYSAVQDIVPTRCNIRHGYNSWWPKR